MRDDTKRRPRGRPRAFDEAEARKQILARFWQKGLAASSLDELSAATGMGRPSLYAAFGNKESMYLAALQEFRGLLEVGVRELLVSKTCRGGLERFFEGALALYGSGDMGPRGCFVVCTASVEAPESPAIREALAGILNELDQALGLFFRRFFEPEQARAKGRLAASFLHSLAIRARAGLPETELRALLGEAVSVLI